MSTDRRLTAHALPTLSAQPLRRRGISAFPVSDELVLLSPAGELVHALNESAAFVWTLCDGSHTAFDMLRELRARYDGDDSDILADLTEALFRFHRLGLIEVAGPARDARKDSVAKGGGARPAKVRRVRFVFGVEDKSYFHWQLAILFESLVGQLGTGWDITVVVCNDHARISAELTQLLEVYGALALTGVNHAHKHAIDFASGNGGYAALNRVEALRAMADHVEHDDIVCLMDTDVFLYGDLRADLFPAGNAMASNRVMDDPLFMGYGSKEYGIDLQKLLGALGCDTALKRGAVTVFVTGATLGNPKVIQDCFRFAQILYLLGKTAGLPEHNVWIAEMACFALALTANGVDYALLDAPQFAVPDPEPVATPAGSFFHYYADINDGRGGPFLGSQWNKQLFHDEDLLAGNLESFRDVAQSDVERRFFDLSMAARRRREETRAP